MHTSDNDAPSNPLDSLYCATTEVVRSVTTLSRHSHDPIQSDYGLQLKNDVMKIAEDVEKLYLEVDSVGKGLSNAGLIFMYSWRINNNPSKNGKMLFSFTFTELSLVK